MTNRKITSTDEVMFKTPTFILEGNRIQITGVRFPLEFNNLTITRNHFLYLRPVFVTANGAVINTEGSTSHTEGTTTNANEEIPALTFPPNVSFIMLDLCGQVLTTGTYIEAQDIVNKNSFTDISITADKYSNGFNPMLTYSSSAHILPISLATRYNFMSTFPLFNHKLLEDAVHSLLGVEAPRLSIDFSFDKLSLTQIDDTAYYVLINTAISSPLNVTIDFDPYKSIPSTKEAPLCRVTPTEYRIRLPYVFKKIDNILELLNTKYCSSWDIKSESFLYYNTTNFHLPFNNLYADEFLSLFKTKIVGYKSPNLLPPQRVKLCCSKHKNFDLLANDSTILNKQNTLVFITLPEILYYGTNFTYNLSIEVVLGGKLFIYLSDEDDNFVFKNNLKCELDYTEIV